ncbi:hypothetical protein FOMPIDRAFT_1045916 [Fomitopsis schrenkii]|uniref:Uncharacterized protein n=1 Tax=Fomitopsis schrenkii TaxID=2126942 RepID=S8FTZ0_FOMSC|nr:hypothetical protein FOMPIDRAFT_1045916 [Fomitopsis schrenkii]
MDGCCVPIAAIVPTPTVQPHYAGVALPRHRRFHKPPSASGLASGHAHLPAARALRWGNTVAPRGVSLLVVYPLRSTPQAFLSMQQTSPVRRQKYRLYEPIDVATALTLAPPTYCVLHSCYI